MSKPLKVFTIIFSIFFVILMLFLCIYYCWPWNKYFFDIASKEFLIPGLDTNFVPQGMSIIDGQDRYLISGYMSDNTPSRVYVISNNKIEKYFTLTQENIDYKGHAGGIISKGGTIWIVGDGYCSRFHLSDVNNVKNAGKVSILDSFATNNGADFVFENNGYLWIGEFYKQGKYETKDSHKLTTRSGEVNPALAFGYKIDESMAYGLFSKTPEKALSLREKCQGVAVTTEGKFVLSCSYSISDSAIYYYKDVLNEEKHGEFILGKHILDLWYLDNESILNEINAPSMSEEIVIKNDRLYILFESACKKYRIFNRKRLQNVYSISIQSLESKKN